MRKERFVLCGVLLVSMLVSFGAYASAFNPDPTNVIVQMVDLLPDMASTDTTDNDISLVFTVNSTVEETEKNSRSHAIWRSSKPAMSPAVFTPATFGHQKIPWRR